MQVQAVTPFGEKKQTKSTLNGILVLSCNTPEITDSFLLNLFLCCPGLSGLEINDKSYLNVTVKCGSLTPQLEKLRRCA